jgi:hypothetical protein
MIVFNPKNKAELTYDEIGYLAMKITDKSVAKKYLNDYSEWILDKSENQISRDEATDIAKSNLGYWSGYYSHDERLNFQNIFDLEHPIFGSKTPTAEEAFEMGVNFAKNNL